MHIRITNNGDIPVPFTSVDGGGIAVEIEPGKNYIVDDAEIQVATYGDNPSFAEDLKEALGTLFGVIKSLIRVFRKRTNDQRAAAEDAEVLCTIDNIGPNALRVILGVNTDDVDVDAGESYVAQAPGYVEIRELGV